MPTREDVIHNILGKKELQGVEHSFVRSVLEKELRKRPKTARKLESLSIRSAEYKQLVKAVRAVLRRNVGLYEGNPEHQQALLAELRQSSGLDRRLEITGHLLSTHASTRERLPFYDEVWHRIFEITGKPGTILDIGCGLNPISCPETGAKYVGVDIDRNVCLIVSRYFDIVGIDGECRVVDARALKAIAALPQSDLALVFKLLDLIDAAKGHYVSEALIKAIPARWVVVSFPTLKIGGKPMRVPRRAWFEQMLKRIGWAYKTFSIPNEIFYVVNKH